MAIATKPRYDHLITSRNLWKKSATTSRQKLRDLRRDIKKINLKEKEHLSIIEEKNREIDRLEDELLKKNRTHLS